MHFTSTTGNNEAINCLSFHPSLHLSSNFLRVNGLLVHFRGGIRYYRAGGSKGKATQAEVADAVVGALSHCLLSTTTHCRITIIIIIIIIIIIAYHFNLIHGKYSTIIVVHFIILNIISCIHTTCCSISSYSCSSSASIIPAASDSNAMDAGFLLPDNGGGMPRSLISSQFFSN
jgi:hypothetical protein